MDVIDILTKLWVIVGTPSLALIGYQQYQIRQLQQKVDAMISSERVEQLLIETELRSKEKLVDRLDPIASRLSRIEDKIDDMIERQLDKLN